jgi:hypothetical protein
LDIFSVAPFLELWRNTHAGIGPAHLMGIRKMHKINEVAAALAATHGAAAFSVRVKSDRLAIVSLEFITEWARHFEVRDGKVAELA